MKYRLKDKELQKKLDELSGGEFSKALQNPHSEALLRMPPIETLNVNFGGTIGKGLLQARFTMRLLKDDVEAVPEYNPHGWNKYPEVTPPEGVLMATEFYWSRKDFEDEDPCRSCWMFKNGKWHWMDGRDCLVDYGWKNIRFRPWSQ